jgi:hypothetical protein
VIQKKFEILTSLPTYGPMYFPISETGKPFFSEGIPVRFYRADGTDWVANFEPGWTDLKQIIELSKTENVLVIACGTCYFMNPNNVNPVSVFGVGYKKIFETTNNRFVLQDQTDFTIIEADGRHWNTERITWDGFAEVDVKGNVISGLAYNPTHEVDEWLPFSYDINEKKLIGGSFRLSNKKRRWWKIF